MGILTRDQDKAHLVAREIVKDFNVGDLEVMITNSISSEEYDTIRLAIDPDYEKLRDEKFKTYERLHKRLKDKKDPSLLNRLSDIELQLNGIESIAGFHLGFATALSLLGRKS